MIGEISETVKVDKVVGIFKAIAAEGFHLVEHVLLRSSSNLFMSFPENDPYSFRFTVLLPAWPGRFRDHNFRDFVEKTLRLEAPAHTLARICWLDYSQMSIFEKQYHKWLCRKMNFSGSRACAEEEKTLKTLITIMSNLTSVYPTARVHDSRDTGNEDSSIVQLDTTMLGTF